MESTNAPGTTRASEGVDKDYPPFLTTSVEFQGSQESTYISVPINDDHETEETESFQIFLRLPTTLCDLYPVVDSVNFARLDIEDDDSRF